MTTKRVPPGHDHSQDLISDDEKAKQSNKKPVKPIEELIPVERRLPRTFKR